MIRLLQAVLYYVMFSMPVAADQSTDTLLNLSLRELGNVVVSVASKKSETITQAPSVVSVITAEDIRKFGAINLMDILRRVPSAYPLSSNLYPNALLSMRGDLATHIEVHVLTLVNGRPVRESMQGGAMSPIYSTFPIAAIERLEIIRGPGSVLYGSNAYTGVINIVTKPDVDPGSFMRMSAGIGSFGTQKYGFSLRNNSEESSFFFSGEILGTDGWRLKATDETGNQDTMDRGQDHLSLYGHYYAGNLNVELFASKSEMDIFGPTIEWPTTDLEQTHVLIDFGYHFSLLENWDIKANYTLNWYEQNLDFVPVPAPFREDFGISEPTEATSFSQLLEVANQLQLSERVDLLVGATADHHRTKLEAGGIAQSVGGYLARVPTNSEVWLTSYAQMEWQVAERFKLVSGLQWNKPEDTGADVSPRVSAIYSLSDDWTAKLMYGEAFRSGYPFERKFSSAVLVGQEQLEPETIKTIEAQLTYKENSIDVTTTIYRNEQEDLIVRVPIGAGPLSTYSNRGKLVTRGLELEGSLSIGENWSFNGSYLYQNSEDETGADDATHIPDQIFKLGLAYETSAFSLGLFASYFGDPVPVSRFRSDIATTNEEAEDYIYLTANISVDLNNLLGRSESKTKLVWDTYADNLLDSEIHFPEFNRRIINTLPLSQGRALYTTLRLEL